jgi:hypothetical protein
LIVLVLAVIAIVTRLLDMRSLFAMFGLLLFGVVMAGVTTLCAWSAARTTARVVAAETPATPVDVAKDREREHAAEPSPNPGETFAITLEADTAAAKLTPRPKWVGAEPVLTGEVQSIPVCSGPFEQVHEARRALDEQLRKAVDEYIDDYFHETCGARLQASQFIKYDLNYIKSHLIGSDKTYHEVVQVSFGPMHQMHAQVTLDAAFRKDLEARRADLEREWRKMVAAHRVLGTGLGFGVLLGILSLICGYFKLDTFTRGYYSRRLQVLTGGAILGVVVAGAVLARWIAWM